MLMNEIMKQRYRVYCRQGGIYYAFDRFTGKRESLETTDHATALRLLHARNEAHQQPIINHQIARAYLAAGDPEITKRSWQVVMEEIIKTKRDETRERWLRASKDHAFNIIRHLPVFETRAEHFLKVLESGTVATNVFLRRLHNFALDTGWLPWPVLPKKRWPTIHFKMKRAITWAEHQAIVAREPNIELRTFYELLWETGGSQSDIATLNADNIDWTNRVLTYQRHKTGTMSRLHFGDRVEHILKRLPQTGPLFPRLAIMHEKHRCKEFHRRCKGLGIQGISLHSYRYAWAERAKVAGYPERFAQEALGHNSKAVHRAYARNAHVILPSLESFEKKAQEAKILTFPAPESGQPQPVNAAQT